jgi:hypothetical protein
MTDDKESTPRPAMSKDEVALELTRFIASTTGLGKSGNATGFGGKTGTKTTDEQIDALLQLYERCRAVVNK